MEWSLHISGPADLAGQLTPRRLATLESSASLRPIAVLTAQLIAEHFDPIRFTHCAFGNEFCEHLLPSPDALTSAIGAARAHNLRFTLLTPYVSNAGIAQLRELLRLLEPGDEVVFSDWGVLNLVRREFPELTPVQGRLLNKSLRDPRVTTVYATAPAPTSALAALQRSNLDSASYTEFLERLGVQTVEMDNLPQGNDLSFAERGMRIGCYLPYGFISTSRVCQAAGLHYHKSDKFQPGAPCRHECQTHLLEHTYSNSPFGNRDQKFYLKGNSYFYAQTEAMMRALLEGAQSGKISRLTWQPRLPMMAHG